MSSGEFIIDLTDTEPAPPPSEPGIHDQETWPSIPVAPPVARLDLTTNILEHGEEPP